MSGAVTLAEIATAMAVDKSTISRLATRSHWAFAEVAGKGGRAKLFDVTALPADVRDALARHQLIVPTSTSPATTKPAESTKPKGLAAWQIATRDARLALVAEVATLSTRFDCGQSKAIDALVDLARKGQLRPDLAAKVPLANARSGGAAGKRTLSRRSLYRWIGLREEGGVDALLPQTLRSAGDPAWVPFFFKIWRDPRNPSLHAVLKDLPKELPEGMAPPTYDQARRFLAALPPQERERGRKGKRAMVALRSFTKRDTSDLEPTAIYTADGKLVPAKVRNPLSGLPFKPEVTTVLDVATRRALGWSASLAENASAVADAFRMAVLEGGVPAIWYTDNGPGFDNHRFDEPLTGILARLGTINMDSLPDRSHSRGIIEAFQKTWNRAAKRLPSYLGKDMDPEAYKLVDKTIDRDVAQFGQSSLVMSWDNFLIFCQGIIDEYNDRPHSGLARIADPITGKRRHPSPNEAWAAWEAKGWTSPVPVDRETADDLFRSYELKPTKRGIVTLIGNEYFHPALEPLHGQKVAVGYDIHDASRVWVREIDFGKEAYRVGRLICVAEWNAHQTRYVPVSVQQKGDEQRVSAALKRLEDKAETKRAELTGPRVVEVQTEEPLLLAPDVAEAVEVMAKALEAPEVVDRPRLTLVRDEPAPSIAAPKPEALADPAARPKLTDDISWARWLMDHPERWEKHDHVGMASLVRDGKFRILAEYNDLDLEALDALVRAKAAEAAVHNQSNDTKGYTHHAG